MISAKYLKDKDIISLLAFFEEIAFLVYSILVISINYLLYLY